MNSGGTVATAQSLEGGGRYCSQPHAEVYFNGMVGNQGVPLKLVLIFWSWCKSGYDHLYMVAACS